MSYLRGFIPWIAYAVIASFGWQWGALSALGISVAMVLLDRRSGVRADGQILEFSAAIFFAALTVVAFVAPDSGVEHYDSVLSFGWLALTAWASLGVGKPFTEGIARREVAREYWHTPAFHHINVVITAVWAAAFTATCTAVGLIFAFHLGGTADIVAQALGFIVPVAFTNWYKGAAVKARSAAVGA